MFAGDGTELCSGATMPDVNSLFTLRHLPHAPPFRPRFWVYCITAYLMPVIVQIVLPADPGSTDELVWLVTLAPAFLLSLHYGLKGALMGLLGGTVLFITVQLIIALNFTPDDWRVTVPIFIAYGTLAITVGWLSEELHLFYNRSLKNERMAAIGQFAVTVRHEVNNALTAIVAESQFLLAGGSDITESQKAAVHNIYESARRIARNIERMTKLEDAPVTTYLGDVKMVDLAKAKTRPEEDTS
jgi:signal transduction histidine kinase